MADRYWAALVPEFSCADFDASLAFYTDVLGFTVEYARAENQFAYLSLGWAQIMLEQVNGNWATGVFEAPFGRGLNFQIMVDDVQVLHDRVVAAGVAVFQPMAESWYRAGDIERGQREFLVQDVDGYLLRFCEDLGEREARHV